MVINVIAYGCCRPHSWSLQNQNPFQTFTGLWLSLPRAAKALLLWAALQSAVTIAYASAIFATPQASQEFVFPLLVRPAAHGSQSCHCPTCCHPMVCGLHELNVVAVSTKHTLRHGFGRNAF